jgi:hypothetical protein
MVHRSLRLKLTRNTTPDIEEFFFGRVAIKVHVMVVAEVSMESLRSVRKRLPFFPETARRPGAKPFKDLRSL